MDIELARTFLEIMRCGSFVAAADKLHISQTAVTARIRNLEELLNCRLFRRSRSGTSLTTEGQAFAAYASELVQTWDRARSELPALKGKPKRLVLGGETALCKPLLLQWVKLIQAALPQVKLEVTCANTQELYERLEAGSLDAALVYRGEYSVKFLTLKLLEEKLIMVASPGKGQNYIFVNWGEEFLAQHIKALPGMAASDLRFDYGPLALSYILKQGGRGYFRANVVKEYLDSGSLIRVNSVPEFSYPIFLARSRQNNDPSLIKAIELINDSMQEALNWSATPH